MPITALSRLAARLLGADLISISPGRWGRLAGLSSWLPRFRRAGKPNALVVARMGGGLNMMTYDPRWRFAFNRVAGLVIDSYRTNRYPSVRILSDYDQLDVMAYPNDLEKVRDLTRRPVEYFGWGVMFLIGGEFGRAHDRSFADRATAHNLK